MVTADFIGVVDLGRALRKLKPDERGLLALFAILFALPRPFDDQAGRALRLTAMNVLGSATLLPSAL